MSPVPERTAVGGVLPVPPILVPELATGADGGLDELRGAAVGMLDAVATTAPLVVVAPGPGLGLAGPGAAGDLAAYGRPRAVVLPGRAPAVEAVGPVLGTAARLAALAPALCVPAVLLGLVAHVPERVSILTVPADLPAARAGALAADLVAQLAAGGVVVAAGDLSARRGAAGNASLRPHPAAAAHDEAVHDRLRRIDLAALVASDRARSEEVTATLRAPLAVLAAYLLRSAAPDRLAFHTDYFGAPYGVCYLAGRFEEGGHA